MVAARPARRKAGGDDKSYSTVEWRGPLRHHPAMLRRSSLLTILGLAWVAGCAATETTPAAPAAPNARPTLDDVVAAARADAARRSGRAAASLQVLSAERVTWSDGSLGCPRPGMAYTMALVPGYRVRLGADGQAWDYHADLRGALVLCPAGLAVEPGRDSRY